MSKVGLLKTPIESCSREKIEELLNLINYRPQKEKILIKPNLVTDTPAEKGVITHPKVVEAICDYFIERGHLEIIIGEGSAFFHKPHHFEHLLKVCGYEDLQKKPEVTILNLEEKSVERDIYPWKYGELKLPKLIKTHEYVNVPTMKTHYQTRVTLGCKNQKGLLQLKDKKNFHRQDLNPYILELNNLITPDLTIMDAIYGLEGNGPALNPMSYPVELNLLLASRDTRALDNACCKLMGIEVAEVPHLPKEKFKLVGKPPLQEVQRNFKKPTWITYFDNIGRYMAEKCCTSCQIANSQMLRKIEFTPELEQQFEKLKNKYKTIYTVYGADPDLKELKINENVKILCFGNCTKKFAEEHNYPWIGGCPPEYHEMVHFLLNEGQISEENKDC